MTKIRTLFVEDNPDLVDRIQQSLKDEPHRSGIESIGFADNAEDAKAMLNTSPPVDVVVIDLHLRRSDGSMEIDASGGLALIRHLDVKIRRRVLVVTWEGFNPRALAEVDKLGVRSIIRKNKGTAAAILQAIPVVFAGQSVRDYEIGDLIGSTSLSQPIAEFERDIMELVAHGETDQQIAQKLNIPLGTLKKRLQEIMRKLGVGTRAQIAYQYARLELGESRQ